MITNYFMCTFLHIPQTNESDIPANFLKSQAREFYLGSSRVFENDLNIIQKQLKNFKDNYFKDVQYLPIFLMSGMWVIFISTVLCDDFWTLLTTLRCNPNIAENSQRRSNNFQRTCSKW